MRARYDLAMAYIKIDGTGALEAALGHFRDMLRLCRGDDNMGVREQIPVVLVRLCRDQEAFDFIQWWATKGSSKDYDWGGTDLDCQGEDVLKPFDGSKVGSLSLSHSAIMMLIEIRLMISLGLLDQMVLEMGAAAPRDRMEIIRERDMSEILLSRRDIVDRRPS
jgi:hypothetical protein